MRPALVRFDDFEHVSVLLHVPSLRLELMSNILCRQCNILFILDEGGRRSSKHGRIEFDLIFLNFQGRSLGAKTGKYHWRLTQNVTFEVKTISTTSFSYLFGGQLSVFWSTKLLQQQQQGEMNLMGCGLWDVACGMWLVGCGLCDAACAMWLGGCGLCDWPTKPNIDNLNSNEW